MASAPRRVISILSLRAASLSVSRGSISFVSASYPRLAIRQMWRIRSISARVLIMRAPHTSGLPSTISMPVSSLRSLSRSITGILSDISRPSSAPTRPNFRGKPESAALSRLIPSSSGTGAGQDRTSFTQVLSTAGAPSSGMTAIGSPFRGAIRNQGRVGLSQNCMSRPEK